MTGRVVEKPPLAATVRRALLAAVGLAIVAAGGAAAYVAWGGPPTIEPTIAAMELSSAGDATRGRGLAERLCWSCHLDGATGALSGRSLALRFPDDGVIWSANITRSTTAGIGEWSAEEIAFALRRGANPRSGDVLLPTMPRYPRMADDDLADLIAFLRSEDPWVSPVDEATQPSEPSFSVKLGMRTRADSSPPVPPRVAPDEADLQARGAYLVEDVLQCHRCHSGPPGETDYSNPKATRGYLAGGAELRDENGMRVSAANLTPHASGLGGSAYESLRAALLEGVGPNGRTLRWPMPRFTALREAEVEAIHAYLESLAPVSNDVSTPETYVGVSALIDEGEYQFHQLACQTCHGTGEGDSEVFGGFSGLKSRFPDDAALEAYLRDPRASRPDSVMPGIGDRLDDDAMRKLMGYVWARASG